MSEMWSFCQPPAPPRGPPRAPGAFIAAAGPDFCLGNFFYYYELNVCSINKSNFVLTPSIHSGLVVISLAFHPDDPGSIPGRSYFKFHKFLFLISNRDKKFISQSSQAMQHLKLLQFQEFGISELKVDPILRAYTAMRIAQLSS